MKRIFHIALVAALLVPPNAIAGQQSASPDTPVFVAYYWRAKPGKVDEYNDYIKTTAEPIDEDARRAGVFEEVRTVTPAPGTSVDWTHLRIFRLKNAAAEQALAAGLDAATARVASLIAVSPVVRMQITLLHFMDVTRDMIRNGFALQTGSSSARRSGSRRSPVRADSTTAHDVAGSCRPAPYPAARCTRDRRLSRTNVKKVEH